MAFFGLLESHLEHHWATPLLVSGQRKLHKKDLARLTSHEVFQSVLRTYVLK
jgi:hypothetical protein